MEINVANLARHNFFVESQKLDEKHIFGELSIAQIQKITGNAIPVTTKSGKVRN